MLQPSQSLMSGYFYNSGFKDLEFEECKTVHGVFRVSQDSSECTSKNIVSAIAANESKVPVRISKA